MLETALDILKQIESFGYKAYIVGGFVRDYILGKKSPDVDITTNATPMDIKDIFPNSFVPNEVYGSITVISNKIRFEITTFREEFAYKNNRKPTEIKYIDSLYDDLIRRDFTINTFCMDSSGKVIDLLGAKNDLNNKIIKTVHDSTVSFTEDALRILRAIRFATVLDFKLDDDTKTAIKSCKQYLKNISYNRKKSELDKIFMSNNASYGVELLKELDICDDLEIYNIDNIKLSTDLVGIWASLDVSEKYPFTKSERELIDKIKLLTNNDLDNKTLYEYGPYVCGIVAENKGLNKNDIINKYNNLPIKSRNDIVITSSQIIDIFNEPPGRYISNVFLDLENEILCGRLKNEERDIFRYIKDKYL